MKPSLSALSLAALLGAIALPASAAKLHVQESVELAATPAAVWKLTGSFGGLADWHPALASSEITKGKDNVPGAVRVLTIKDGGKIVETLKAYDAKKHSMTYVIDESPLPVAGYKATFKVLPYEKGSKVVWSADFTRAGSGTDEEARKVISGIFTAGFESLQAKLGK